MTLICDNYRPAYNIHSPRLNRHPRKWSGQGLTQRLLSTVSRMPQSIQARLVGTMFLNLLVMVLLAGIHLALCKVPLSLLHS
jgi:hypothetical protein